jgi:hypothetical protein
MFIAFSEPYQGHTPLRNTKPHNLCMGLCCIRKESVLEAQHVAHADAKGDLGAHIFTLTGQTITVVIKAWIALSQVITANRTDFGSVQETVTIGVFLLESVLQAVFTVFDVLFFVNAAIIVAIRRLKFKGVKSGHHEFACIQVAITVKVDLVKLLFNELIGFTKTHGIRSVTEHFPHRIAVLESCTESLAMAGVVAAAEAVAAGWVVEEPKIR